MDLVQIFNDELQSLLDSKLPVSKAKMGLITRAAMKGVKFYKHIVLSVERFIAKCQPEYKIPGLYVIDSIVRQSRHQFGIERDVYAIRFSRYLGLTFENLFNSSLPEDKPKIVRVLNLWLKNGVFSSQVIQPLLEMADDSGGQANSASAASPDNVAKVGQSSSYHHSSSSRRNQKPNETSLKFSKNMLDFDYGEEDDGDETPTEAEPPLSSTLSKIEMEQRGHQKNSCNSKSSPAQHYNSQYHQQDPVLERWNRIIRGENTDNVPDNRSKRSRSRSPPRSSSMTVRTSLTESKNFVYKPPPTAQPKSDSTFILKKDTTRELEREKKCLPKIRDKHLTVCSSTLWLGHVPKTVSEADLSNAFGEYGSITSIDLIPPRGCAYVCMDRRQDAKRALDNSKDLKLSGSHIKMAWAPGKGFKEYKKLKDFWEVETGSSFIPYSRIDETIDFDVLEEGGVIDEDSMSMEMRERREKKQKEKDSLKTLQDARHQQHTTIPMTVLPLMNQPLPPTSIAPFNIPNSMSIPPPSALSQGMIHYPPPSVPIVTSAAAAAAAAAVTSIANNTSALKTDESNTGDNVDESPSSLEQQLNMVEQQLNMLKQAQNIGGPHNVSHPGTITTMQPPPMFNPQNQPNPMIFDVPLPGSLLPGGQPLLDPNIFVNPAQLLCQPPRLLPIVSQASMLNPTDMHNHMMPHQQGRY